MEKGQRTSYLVTANLDRLPMPESSQERIAEQLARATLSELSLTQDAGAVTFIPAITSVQKKRFGIPADIHGGIFIRHLEKVPQIEEAIKMAGIDRVKIREV